MPQTVVYQKTIKGPMPLWAQGHCRERKIPAIPVALSLPVVHIAVRGRDFVMLTPSLIDPLSSLGNTPAGKRFASMASTHSQGVLKALLEKKKVTLAQSKRYLDQERERQLGCAPLRSHAKATKKHCPSMTLVCKRKADVVTQCQAKCDPIIRKIIAFPNEVYFLS